MGKALYSVYTPELGALPPDPRKAFQAVRPVGLYSLYSMST